MRTIRNQPSIPPTFPKIHLQVRRVNGPCERCSVKRHITEETIPMKQTWHGHSAFRIEAGEAKILIDPFLSDNPSRDNGWSGCLTGKNSTQGGDR
jgi:Beta-lactamase superfamily domain